MMAAGPQRPVHRSIHVHCTNLLRNFISFYHQAYRAAVWSSRHDFLDACAE